MLSHPSATLPSCPTGVELANRRLGALILLGRQGAERSVRSVWRFDSVYGFHVRLVALAL